MSLPAADNFNRPDEDPMAMTGASANWTTAPGCSRPRVRSNGCLTSATGSAPFGIFWNADAFADDQYAQATPVHLFQDANGPAVRMATTGGLNGYCLCFRSSTTLRLFKVVNGAFTQLGSQFAVSANQSSLGRIEVRGSTIEVFLNGVSLGTRTDESHNSGAAGLIIANGYDNWEGGNLTPAGPDGSPVPALMNARRRIG